MRLTRSGQFQPLPHEYMPPEVLSVRDLYPRRITELADVGKLFAAACMALRFFNTAPSDHPTLMRELNNLLASFHNTARLKPFLKSLLAGQQRYNGHLHSHLKQAREIILGTAHQAIADVAASQVSESPGKAAIDIKKERDRLLKALFQIFLSTEE